MPLDFDVLDVKFTNSILPDAVGKTNHASDSSIGAHIKADITIELSGTLQDATPAVWAKTTVVFNPGLFVRSGANRLPAQLNVGYFTQMPNVVSVSDEFEMELNTNTAYENVNKNERCSIKITSTTQAVITFHFVLTMDLGEYIAGGQPLNRDRLIKSHKNNAFDINNLYDSVYRNTNREFGMLITIGDKYLVMLRKNFTERYRARFYRRGLPNNADDGPLAEMVTNQAFELRRGNTLVNDLSAYQWTDVRMYVDQHADYEGYSDMMVYVIDVTDNANVNPFPIQYGNPGVLVPEGSIAGTDLGYHVISAGDPVTMLTHNGNPAFMYRFRVGTDLNPARRYSLIVVAKYKPTSGSTDNNFTNSYILHNLAANGLPAAPQMGPDNFMGTLIDYNVDPETDNVKSTVTDFLLSKLRVQHEQFNIDPLVVSSGVSWAENMSGIKIQLMDDATEEILYAYDFSRNNAGVFTGPGSNVVRETVDGGWSTYEFELHGQFPNEAGLPDFSNRTIRVRWVFLCYFPFAQWRVDYKYDQRVLWQGYMGFTSTIQEINLYEYETGLPLENLCGSDMVLVEVILNSELSAGYLWNIRVGWTLEPHGFNYEVALRPNGLNAEQAYTGLLTQLDDSQITLLPAQFGASDRRALFVFDHSSVAPGSRVRLHVIAEPFEEVVPAFVCEGVGTGYFRAAYVGDIQMRMVNSAGPTYNFGTIRHDDESVETYALPPGMHNVTTPDGDPHEYCFHVGTNAGVVNNSMTELGFNLPGYGLLELDVSRLLLLTSLNAQSNSLETMNLLNNTALISFDLSGNGMTSIVMPAPGSALVFIDLDDNDLTTIDLSGRTAPFMFILLRNNDLTNTDAIINALNAANPTNAGTLALEGGTSAPRTGASLAAYTAMTGRGWSITTNP